MKNHFYKVAGYPGDGYGYKLGYTTNKKACLRYHVDNGWKKNQIVFTEMGIERTDEFGQRI